MATQKAMRLTRHIAMGTFFLLTEERIKILLGCPDALYLHCHMRTAKKLQHVRLKDVK